MSDNKIHVDPEVKIDELEMSIEQMWQLVWALVHQAGGTISVPYRVWSDAENEDHLLVATEDVANMSIVLTAVTADIEIEDDKSDVFDPRDVSTLGGDPSL